MVERFLSLLTVLIWLAQPTTGFSAAPPFGLAVESSQVEYGKPLYIDLHTAYPQPPLEELDLSPMDRDFVVQTYENVDHETDSGQQSWRIRLYPRRPGETLIPSLAFHGINTEPVRVIVTPSFDHKDNAPIRVSSEVSDTAVWINQAVQVTMQVESGSRYAWLDTETAQQNDIEIVPVPFARHTRALKGRQRTQHRIGWILHPQASGTTTIQLPPVKYKRDGTITHWFYPPEIELHVRALPAYVPPTIPVGRIELEASVPDQLFFVKRELAFLSLRITGEGPPGQYLPGLSRQLKSNQTVTFYPAQVRADDNSDQAGIRRDSVYQVPFAPKVMGLISLPSVRLQYFDPSTGKIQAQSRSLGKFIAISQWVVYVGVTGLLLGAIALLRFTGRKLKQQLKVYQSYRTALHRIQQAETPEAVKSALMDIAGAEAWPTNLTLAVWLHYWVTRYPRMSSVSDSILRLQVWLYGQTEATLEEIRPCLVDICYRRMPLLKILK